MLLLWHRWDSSCRMSTRLLCRVCTRICIYFCVRKERTEMTDDVKLSFGGCTDAPIVPQPGEGSRSGVRR